MIMTSAVDISIQAVLPVSIDFVLRVTPGSGAIPFLVDPDRSGRDWRLRSAGVAGGPVAGPRRCRIRWRTARGGRPRLRAGVEPRSALPKVPRERGPPRGVRRSADDLDRADAAGDVDVDRGWRAVA